jgi:4-hydroxy-4-methyl-2-oxoglutarate aldolase
MDNLIARLAALDTCAVSDALDKLGLPGAVVGLSALTGPAKVAGRVVTIIPVRSRSRSAQSL